MPVIPVGSGLAAQLVAKDEATFGVAPSLTSGIDSFEFQNETLELKKTAVDPDGLAAGKVFLRTKRRVVTSYAVTGDVNMQVPTRNLGFWLRHMVGDFTQAPAQIASSGVYKTVFQPRSGMFGHSFTLQKGVPTVDNATVEPFTYVGCKIASWEMAVATGGIATMKLSIDARNELAGAGNGDPLNGSVPTLATFNTPTNGLGLQNFHFRQATISSGGTPTMAATTNTLTTPGFPATTVPVTNTTGQTAMVTITGGTLSSVVVNGIQVGTTAGTYPVPANQNIAITYSSAPTWQWFQGVVSLTGTTALGNVKNVSFGESFSWDSTRIFVGSSGFKAEQVENGMRHITGSATIEWLSSEAIYNAFAADTTTSLEVTFTGPAVGGQNYLLDVIIPNIKFEGEAPKVPGPAVITQAANFVGEDDEANVPIQITYQSEDTTF